jgi:hypothetical protein
MPRCRRKSYEQVFADLARLQSGPRTCAYPRPEHKPIRLMLMDWLTFSYWCAIASVPGASSWWGWAHSPAGEPAHDDRSCQEGFDEVSLDLVRTMYEIIAGELACTICGAPLGRPIAVERAPGALRAARVDVATECCGRRRHRHQARVLERAGDLQFGQLSPT